MEVLDRPILVLNKNWQPVRISNFKKTLKKVQNTRAKFIDPETFIQYDWEEWLDAFSVIEEEAGVSYIKAKNFSVKMPEVIICTKFNQMPKSELKLTRRNLLIRDNFRCQYCNKKVTMKDSTLDHVLPRSRGGRNTWDNLVICCLDDNVKKGDRTPEEANLKLLKKPVRPKWNPLYALLHKSRPKSWDKFIDTSKWNEVGYWDTELSD